MTFTVSLWSCNQSLGAWGPAHITIIASRGRVLCLVQTAFTSALPSYLSPPPFPFSWRRHHVQDEDITIFHCPHSKFKLIFVFAPFPWACWPQAPLHRGWQYWAQLCPFGYLALHGQDKDAAYSATAPCCCPTFGAMGLKPAIISQPRGGEGRGRWWLAESDGI